MKLELDKRIKSLSDVFNFSDVENARKFIEQKGYFTNTIYFLKNLQSCKYGTLINVFSDGVSYNTFRRKEDGAYYEYFIPESFLKSKEKYRPYTLKEFFEKFTVGQPIKYRKKGNVGYERYLILNGYVEAERGAKVGHIYIGSNPYTLDVLFNNYEWQASDTEDFKPFGVEE